MIQPKTNCPLCGREITKANLLKHYTACSNPNSKLNVTGRFKPLPARNPEDLNCHFCNKLCKNLNAVKQHECRCRENPDRKAFDQLQKNIENESDEARKMRCAKSSQTLREKYASGYINPARGRKITRSYIHKEHNAQEIAKWLLYVEELNIEIPHYETFLHPEGYKVISRAQTKIDNSVRMEFEHIYIADLLLKGKLIKSNTVHHIDSIRDNNNLDNLLIFIDSNNHKRFHNSDYAWLIYDPITHLFRCELRK